MVGRSALVDLRPFRTGAVASTGSLLVLGEDWGGYVGQGLEAVVARLLGETGALILASTASRVRRPARHGALARRAAGAFGVVRRAGYRRTPPARPPGAAGAAAGRHTFRSAGLEPFLAEPHGPPVDAVSEFPDVVGRARRRSSPSRTISDRRRSSCSSQSRRP